MPDEEVRSEKVDSNADGVGPVLHFREYGRHGRRRDRRRKCGSVTVTAPSVFLMEASTGKVLYERDADTRRPPASVTKVMTILLIYDALSAGKFTKKMW